MNNENKFDRLTNFVVHVLSYSVILFFPVLFGVAFITEEFKFKKAVNIAWKYTKEMINMPLIKIENDEVNKDDH